MSRIVKLIAENVKRLSAVEITPDGNIIVLGGENGAGKSSVLDAIAMAIGGGDEIPAEPLRQGAKSGRIQITLDDLIITRKFRDSGTTSLTVEGMDGSKFNGPQSVLDALVGKLAFDPLEFMRKKAPEQAEVIRQIAGVDFTDLDKRRAIAYDKRRDMNRDVERLSGAINSAYSFPDAPKELLDSASLNEELRKANDSNSAISLAKERLNQMIGLGSQQRETMEADAARVIRLTAELAEAQESAKKSAAAVKKTREEYALAKSEFEKMTLIDTAPINERLSGIEEINSKVRANKKKADLILEKEDAEKASALLSREIEEIDAEKKRLISAAPLPIAGLLFDADGVSFNGIPLAQASGAEQLRISIAIASAANPKLRVMLCKDGALLDDTSMKILEEFAEANDQQIWIEDCRAGDRATVTIVDGHIKDA